MYNETWRSAHGQRRHVDKFVRYPYPQMMGTQYQREHHTKPSYADKEAFNVEKEHKIINPHRMELRTTQRVDYQPFQVLHERKQVERPQSSKVPFQNTTSYGATFANWGANDVVHERSPQYPVY